MLKTRSTDLWILGLLAGLLLGFYAYRNAYSPEALGDETSLISIPYRAAHFGDVRYPVIYSESFNEGRLRAYPPILALSARTLFHMLAGFSSWSSRMFSASLMVLLALLVAVLARSRGAGRWPTAMALLVVGLCPSMIVSARTVRFEQEVLFLGAIGLFLPLLVSMRCAKGTRRGVWLVSGLGVAWAAMSHPWGLVFPVTLALALLLHHAGWREADGLGFWQRGSWIAAGMLLPVGLTAASIFHDWAGYREYVGASASMYAIRKAQFTTQFASRVPAIVAEHVPDRVAAFLYQVSNFGLFPAHHWSRIYRHNQLFSYGLWCGVPLMAGAALFGLRRRARQASLVPSVAVYLFLVCLTMTGIYPPNETYHVYLSFSFTAALALLAAIQLARPQRTDEPLNWERFAFPALCVFCTVVALHSASAYAGRLARIDPAVDAVSVDRILNEVRTTAESVGLSETEGPVYTDTMAWPAGGRSQASLIDVLAYGVTRRPAGVAYQTKALDFFVDYFPTSTDRQVPIDEKAARFRRAVSGLELSAVVVDRVRNAEYHVFSRSLTDSGGFRYVEILNDAVVRRWVRDTDEPDGIVSQCRSGEYRWNDLPSGRYVVVLPSRAEGLQVGAVRLTADGGKVPLARNVHGFRHAPPVLVFDLQRGMDEILLTGASAAGAAVLYRVAPDRGAETA